MLDSFFLLRAMNGIREDDLILAQKFLDYTDTGPQKRSYRRLISYALIAAVLIALLSVTAYALGWFGVRERVYEVEASQPTAPGSTPAQKQYWISQNGYKDSPEYRANREWSNFYWDYVWNTEIDYTGAFLDGKSADYVETCHYYGCSDQTMADRLFEIADKYGLKLHTFRVTPLSLEDFYKTAGTGAFLTGGGTGGGYIYEDGSFKMEGEIYDPDTGEYRFGFVFEKFLVGTVMPYRGGVGDPADYTEWEYTNVHGDRVLISYREDVNENGQTVGSAMLFFDMDGVYLTVSAGSWSEPLLTGPESAERAADAFLFHEALKSDVDLAHASHGPTVCSDPGEAATWETFLTSDEGKAAAAYWRYLEQQVGELAGASYDPWAKPHEALLGKIAQLSEEYSLTAPNGTPVFVASQEDLDSGRVMSDGPYEIMPDEAFTALGYDPAMCEQLGILTYYDNGVVVWEHWQYIPKGSLTIDLGALPPQEGESWFYRTAKGFTVYITADLEDTRWERAAILYESDKGWFIGRPSWYNTAYELEATADRIDFSVFD